MKSRIGASLVSMAALAWSTAALAGDEPLYEPAPDWVTLSTIEKEERSGPAALLLMDNQARIEKGRLWTYTEFAVALDTPEALTQFGTLSAGWLPDKGDLIIHRAELVRDGKPIDLLADGSQFEILRREKALESRQLDGVLTATMPVTGAQLGDVLRLGFSVTLSDQALGENVQWESGLFADPFPLKDGAVVVSWPKDLPVTRRLLGDVRLEEPEERGGYYFWRADIPVMAVEDMPVDAPLRFKLPPTMQVTTYADWESVSRSMAPHYVVDGTIKPQGDLASEITRIAGMSEDKRIRAAAALALVQDKVSYLLNGLNGGNYLPQMPEETWAKRYGDCKAKSVLLLAILRELGIESEVVLVRSQGGDALPLLGPMPASFNHMIVRAEIEGVNYWLDGTTAGVRIDTLDAVPRFHYALPIRADGAGLIALDERVQTTPDQVLKVVFDQRAGLQMPALLDVELAYRGLRGAPWRAIAEQGEAQQIEDAVSSTVSGLLGPLQLLDHAVEYDAASGVAKVEAKALQSSSWNRERGVYSLELPSQAAADVSFDTDRARAEWREIPLRLNGPVYLSSEFEVLLPDGNATFSVKGKDKISETIGSVELNSEASLDGSRFAISQSLRSVASELAPEEIGPSRRALTRHKRSLPVLRTTSAVREPWEYTGKDAKLLDPIREAFDQVVYDASLEETGPLLNRGGFHMGIFEFAKALEDIDAAYDIEQSRDLLLMRANLHLHLGNLDKALADLEEAELLQPDGSTYQQQVEILALLGRQEEALALAEDFRGLGENELAEDLVVATAMGWAGKPEEGLDLLEQHVNLRPGDGGILNELCWHAGIFDIMTAERLASCTEAVEKAEYSPAVLDSRAMAFLRSGELDKARADLDAVLQLEPGQAASRLLRGIVRKALGDSGASEDIDIALRINPYLRRTYSAWGFNF